MTQKLYLNSNKFKYNFMKEQKDGGVALFGNQKIRRVLVDGEWWFSVVDACGVLTSQSDNLTARKYWNKLSQRLKEEGSQLVTICHQLKFLANDGKYYLSDAANTEGIFRIIQSIPSPKAEPFKRWLAKVGYERVQEIENPELAMDRMKAIWIPVNLLLLTTYHI
jgi:DNA-damage-inducible protein D